LVEARGLEPLTLCLQIRLRPLKWGALNLSASLGDSRCQLGWHQKGINFEYEVIISHKPKAL
jgi:hypothetical protein